MAGLGFSLYEARAYAALVRDNPLTGYELSKRSGVPGSKVYECIERLNRKGIITPVGDNPARYVAVPPEELVRRLTLDFETSVSTLETLLEKEVKPESVDYIFNMNGYDTIIGKAKEMISQAGNTLDLSLWAEEIVELEKDIKAAAGRGVKVRLLSFNGGELSCACVFHHKPLKPTDPHDRWITLVRDGIEVLTGQCDGENAVAAWTRNRCLVFISLKYIEHEIIKIGENGNDAG